MRSRLLGMEERNMVALSPVTAEHNGRSEQPLYAQRLRDEAWRVRRDAERITDEKIRRQLLDIAVQYDVLAETEERRPR
jgi:hypothetical protein